MEKTSAQFFFSGDMLLWFKKVNQISYHRLRLKSCTGKNLVSVHCRAHRFDLAIKLALESENKFYYFNTFNKVFNKL